jgi:hypothetical protein
MCKAQTNGNERIKPADMTSKKLMFWTAAAFFALLPFFAYAGRPLTIDDAAPVSEGHAEVELGYHFKNTSAERDHRLPVITLAYGLTRNLEAGLGLQYIMKELNPGGRRDGFDDVHLAAKYRFVEESPYSPGLAMALDVKLPIKGRRAGLSSGRFDQNFLFLATKSFGPLDLDLNAGYLLVDSPPGEKLENRVLGGLAGRLAVHRQWVLVGEIFGQTREAKGTATEANFQLGVRHEILPPLAIDAAAGRSLRSHGSRFQATFGLTWTFPVKL